MRRSGVRAALRASLTYFFVSLLWIALSSQVIAAFARDRHSLALADSLKIVGYIALTALVIFFVMRREMAARRGSQEALQLDEELYRTILETSEQGVVIINPDGCVTFANQKIMQMLGCMPAGIAGKSLWELAADSGKRVIDLDSLARGQGVREPREVRFSHADGSQVWTKLSASPLYDAYGKFSGALAMVTDTTANRQVEQFAQEQQKTLQAFHVGAQIFSENAELTTLCHAAARLCVDELDAKLAWVGSAEVDGHIAMQAHYPRDSEYLRSLSVRWDDCDQGRGPAGRAIRNGHPQVTYDIGNDPDFLPWREQAVAQGFISTAAFPLTNRRRTLGSLNIYSDKRDYFSPQRLGFYIAFSRQLAVAMENATFSATLREHVVRHEQRLAERTTALTVSNERLSAHVHMMPHDLRAPLQGIERPAGVSAGDYKDNQRAGDYLGRIRGAGERKDDSRQDQPAYRDASRIGPNVGSAHLADVIDEALEQLDGELRTARAQILVQAPMYAVAAHAPTAVRIVANLLSNAVKFVAPDVIARVRVWSEDRGHLVRLWVEDNGIGIAAGDQDRIFRAFERVRDVGHYAGAGIGLAMARHGAQRMGGSVGVESVPGHGSRFWLELPRAQC